MIFPPSRRAAAILQACNALHGGRGTSISSIGWHGLLREHCFCYCRQRAFRAWLWVLWDHPVTTVLRVLVVLARMSESAQAGLAAGISDSCRQLPQ